MATVPVHLADPPPTHDLQSIAEAARLCRACPLWEDAIQTVFGEGKIGAKVLLVGEQPGDIEDREGHPFVGPAGRVLHAAMASAGYGPEDAYLTNAVKHFKWEAKGARRLHKRPTFREATACYPWLASEIENVAPRVIVCLGSTAAQILISKDFKVTEGRGKLMSHKSGHHLVVTLHPSVILRARDTESRELDRRHLIEDLKLALSAANSL